MPGEQRDEPVTRLKPIRLANIHAEAQTAMVLVAIVLDVLSMAQAGPVALVILTDAPAWQVETEITKLLWHRHNQDDKGTCLIARKK
jgi:hypothetical protein